MAYNYNNEYCYQCEEWVWKGEGLRIYVNDMWVTMCRPCATARMNNRKKAAAKRAYINSQPTLFDS
jgi:RNase P subunit RPR2